MSRSLRESLAIVLTVFLTFGPAMRTNAGCCGWYSSPAPSSCCDVPVVVDSCGCVSEVVASCEPVGCCESVVVHEESSCGCGSVESVPIEQPQMMETAKPEIADPVTPTPQPSLEPEEDIPTSDPSPVAEESPVVPVAVPDAMPTPAATESPAADPLFGPTEEVAEEEPVAEEAVMGEPAAEPAADEGFDDMFGQPTEEEPAAVEEDDMFADPAEEEPASDEGLEDMFGEPATEEPADDGFDDMFGEPAAEEPVEEPAETTEEDDAIGDLFGSEPTEEEPTETAPAEEESSDAAEEKDEIDDFFDFGAAEIRSQLQVAGGLQSDKLRQWTDNTARYHCQARLVGTAPGEIVLHKDNGKLKRVPLRRLSQHDLQFVYSQVAAQKELAAHQSATKTLASR